MSGSAWNSTRIYGDLNAVVLLFSACYWDYSKTCENQYEKDDAKFWFFHSNLLNNVAAPALMTSAANGIEPGTGAGCEGKVTGD